MPFLISFKISCTPPLHWINRRISKLFSYIPPLQTFWISFKQENTHSTEQLDNWVSTTSLRANTKQGKSLVLPCHHSQIWQEHSPSSNFHVLVLNCLEQWILSRSRYLSAFFTTLGSSFFQLCKKSFTETFITKVCQFINQQMKFSYYFCIYMSCKKEGWIFVQLQPSAWCCGSPHLQC